MYFGCSMIKMFALQINKRIDSGENCYSLCCEPIDNQPAVAFRNSAHETIEDFIKMYEGVISEGKKFANCNQGNRLYTTACSKCGNYKLGEWDGDGLIHFVNLSMYPAPCQCNCIYCDVHKDGKGVFSKVTCDDYYEQMFDTLNYAREIGLIDKNAIWQISSGEIAIHPYKDRILNLIENQQVVFFTNCFIFDEGIAKNLSSNPNSSINLSIDAGTPQTWLKVKGVNNFELITENLVKYFNASVRPGQINLKYIVLPGINDNLRDYRSLIEIMKILNIDFLSISRDNSLKYNKNSEQFKHLIVATGYLLAMLKKNNMSADMFSFTPDERNVVYELANKLLETGEV